MVPLSINMTLNAHETKKEKATFQRRKNKRTYHYQGQMQADHNKFWSDYKCLNLPISTLGTKIEKVSTHIKEDVLEAVLVIFPLHRFVLLQFQFFSMQLFSGWQQDVPCLPYITSYLLRVQFDQRSVSWPKHGSEPKWTKYSNTKSSENNAVLQ